MTAIFIFGTLCHAPLYEVVAGAPLQARPARLTGQKVVWVDGASYPMLTEGEGADGLLIEVEGEALARLDFYEACFDYHRVPVEITCDGETQIVEAWRPSASVGQPGAEWSLADWARDWGEISTVAAGEVMRVMGKEAPEAVGHRFWMIRARAQSYVMASKWRRPQHIGGGFGRDDFEVLEHRHPYDRFFAVEELRARFKRFGGGWSEPVERAAWRVADAATVLPYDSKRDRVLLVEQARFGLYAHGDAAPWLLEPIAGMVDAGESPETSARREAEEEAGLTIGTLHFVAKYYPSPGGIAQILYSYVGEADLPDGAEGTFGSLAENEDIQTHIIPYEEAVTLYTGGDMADAASLVSFQWLMAHRDRLRALA